MACSVLSCTRNMRCDGALPTTNCDSTRLLESSRSCLIYERLPAAFHNAVLTFAFHSSSNLNRNTIWG